MLENRTPRGLPLPTVWQMLLGAAVIGAAWIIWWEAWGSSADSGVSRTEDLAKDSGAAALENLRAVEAIARSGPDGVPELIGGLENADPRLRRNALFALRLVGPEASEALAASRDHFTDDDPEARALAIDAYWQIGRDPGDVAAAAAPMLGDPVPRVSDMYCLVLV